MGSSHLRSVMQLKLYVGCCNHLKTQLGWMSKIAYLHAWQLMLALASKLSYGCLLGHLHVTTPMRQSQSGGNSYVVPSCHPKRMRQELPHLCNLGNYLASLLPYSVG